MTKEQEEAIEYFNEHINYFKEQIKFIEAVDSDYYDEEYELYKNRVKQFETILSMLKEKDKEIEKKDKRINDLEYALLDMVMQFADRPNIKGSNYALNTMGLSALELAFDVLGFDDPYPVKKAEEKYKILVKQYFERKSEE